MKRASITEIKANLARYVRMVRRGSEVEILERGVPVARLVGLSGAPEGARKERLARLVEAGVLRRGGDLGWVLSEPPVRASGARLSEALDEDRRDRS